MNNSNWYYPKPKGFTLIELLVAISILAVITGIVIFSMGSLQKNARDYRRKSDLKKIQLALQEYYSDQGFYPYSWRITNPYNFLELEWPSTINACTGNPNPCDGNRTYINTTPIESLDNWNHHYCYTAYTSAKVAAAQPNVTDCDNTSAGGFCRYYEIYAELENGPINTYSCEDHVPPPPGGFNLMYTPSSL